MNAVIRTGSKRAPVDVYVGSRLRLRRTQIGMSQEKLAAALGITFQQVQKYERGVNRISASRLLQVAQALDVPLSYFFAGAPESSVPDEPPPPDDRPGERETLELVRAYYKIQDPTVRRRIRDLFNALATVYGKSDDT